MEALHAFLLAVIQGLTEFLPVSSSAHLVLLPIIMHWQDQGLVMDVAAHLGSLLAVMVYFRDDLRSITGRGSASAGQESGERNLAWLLLWATLPILVVAFIFHTHVEQYSRNAIVIAWASIGFALLLWLADWRGSHTRGTRQLTTLDAVLVGLAQALALIPGASRSGVTMTAAMWLGLKRSEAARFSFLLAIPTILATSLYGGYQVWQDASVIRWSFGLGVFACSAGVTYLCIHWFIKFVNRIGILPFVIYRILLGGVLLLAYG